MSASPVLHISKYPPGRGGMDQVLRLHASLGAPTVVLLSPPAKRAPRGLLSRGWSIYGPSGWLRMRARNAVKDHAGMHLFYNAWGADLLGPRPTHAWRVAYLHNHFPNLAAFVKHYAPHVDAFLCVNPATHAAVQSCLPPAPPAGDARARTGCVPCPVAECFFERKPCGTAYPIGNDVPVIGWSGRLQRAQKRIDRLPELSAKLRATGRPYRLEILGDGPDRGWLEQALAAEPNVRILGWREPQGVAECMRTWRYAVTLSDYEGLSLSLVEAMAAGCIPLYPDFHAGGDLPTAASQCLYPPGNIDALTQAWTAIEDGGEGLRGPLRNLLREHAEAHRPERHLSALSAWVESLGTPPPRTVAATPPPPLVPGWRPIYCYNRAYARLTGM